MADDDRTLEERLECAEKALEELAGAVLPAIAGYSRGKFPRVLELAARHAERVLAAERTLAGARAERDRLAAAEREEILRAAGL